MERKERKGEVRQVEKKRRGAGKEKEMERKVTSERKRKKDTKGKRCNLFVVGL